jgi:hypothetical protein
MELESEIKDNCEQIIMKYYIEKKEMKLIDFTRNDVKDCKSFETADIPIIDMKTMNIEDILKKEIGYDTDFNNDETFVIEMTFEKKNNETKLIDFKRRDLQENEIPDKYPTITFDENGNPTHTQDILFKNTKKYKKYLELFEKINEDILFTLKTASTIEYLKSIKSTYYTKGDVINQIYWKIKTIDENDLILQKYKLIMESIRDFIKYYEILEKENKQLEKQKDDNGYYILTSEISYNKYKNELQDKLKKEKQNRIDKLNEIYEIKNAEDLPLFTQLIAEIGTSLGAGYNDWYNRWYLRFHDKNTLKQGIKTLNQNFMTPPVTALPPPPPTNDR